MASSFPFTGSAMFDPSTRIPVHGDGEWLEVHPRGRLEWHRRSSDGHHAQEWIELEFVRNYWPHLVNEVEEMSRQQSGPAASGRTEEEI